MTQGWTVYHVDVMSMFINTCTMMIGLPQPQEYIISCSKDWTHSFESFGQFCRNFDFFGLQTVAYASNL